MVLPVIKLGSLFVRTVSKPIAKQLKQAAAFHPKFRGIIIDLAQGYHRLTTVIRRLNIGHSIGNEIRPLNEERAVEAATDLLGELFVFSVAGLAIVYEVQRSVRAEAKKEELRKQELEKMKQRNEDLSAELKLLKQKLELVEQLARQRNMYRLWNWRGYAMPTTEKSKS
ncbi:hypothetical protein BUALT_Bualt03G0141600 [Buddleja alternifolia]|uniref:Optic atrophy 3 protein n=1 Tax=Buddleja alternifolia TaxID=168488 RepID=A0AAV6XVX6_9LAMI|nr:hypothetical protein BUALT_Bualt03G0141600 [Buddleja alternifolia]